MKGKNANKYSTTIEEFSSLYNLLNNALNEEVPYLLRDGGVIKEGFNEELDKTRNINTSNKEFLVNLEKSERERTKIKSLKVGYNKVFGYYIEVSKGSIKDIKEELKEENYSFEYQYDALGNRTKKLKIINEHTSVIEENTFDEANRIISTSSGDIIYNSYNELSTARLGGSIFDLEWEAKKLVLLSLSAAHKFKYEYNFYGQRTKKIEEVAGAFKYTYYYYNGDKLVKEKIVDDIKGEEYEVIGDRKFRIGCICCSCNCSNRSLRWIDIILRHICGV